MFQRETSKELQMLPHLAVNFNLSLQITSKLATDRGGRGLREISQVITVRAGKRK